MTLMEKQATAKNETATNRTKKSEKTHYEITVNLDNAKVDRQANDSVQESQLTIKVSENMNKLLALPEQYRPVGPEIVTPKRNVARSQANKNWRNRAQDHYQVLKKKLKLNSREEKRVAMRGNLESPPSPWPSYGLPSLGERLESSSVPLTRNSEVASSGASSL